MDIVAVITLLGVIYTLVKIAYNFINDITIP